MKRALILGGTGMLGRAVAEHWRLRGCAALALPRLQADITDRRAVERWAEEFRPEVIVNCAAFTRVDACETETERAMATNGAAVGHVAAVAESAGADLVHISSDYVFDGRGFGSAAHPEPYPEDAPTGPLSAYGKSKLAGEAEALAYPRALVLRSSWLFGPGGPNFVATMLRLARGGQPLRVVADQVGCPTYTPFLARAVWDLIAAGLHGVFHYCNRDAVSWYEFASEIVGPGVEVEPITTQDYPRPAPRPPYSVLAVHRFEEAMSRRVEPWIHGLSAYRETFGEGP